MQERAQGPEGAGAVAHPSPGCTEQARQGQGNYRESQQAPKLRAEKVSTRTCVAWSRVQALRSNWPVSV